MLRRMLNPSPSSSASSMDASTPTTQELLDSSEQAKQTLHHLQQLKEMPVGRTHTSGFSLGDTEVAVDAERASAELHVILSMRTYMTMEEILHGTSFVYSVVVPVLQFLQLPSNLVGGSATRFPGDIKFKGQLASENDKHRTQVIVSCRTRV